MSFKKGSTHRFLAIWLTLILTLSCYAISGVKASPKVEWTQRANPSTGGDGAWGVAVDVSGMYVVGYDCFPGDLEWRIEKRSLVDGSLVWAQVSNPSAGDDSAFGVAAHASGIYVVGIDNSPANDGWRIE